MKPWPDDPPEPTLERVKCLVVDDIEDNLFTMSALLSGPAVEVLTASSGREALELLLVHDFALALLDVQMPGMDGFELAELMRSSERTRHVPLIFVTAGARENQRLFKGYDTGAVDFLFKPVEPWMLEGKASVFFDLHRARQRLAQQLQERTETLRLNEMFSAVLAHDLRAPLSAILAAALLVERAASEDVVRAAGGRIRNSGQAMSRMIADLLDLSRARLGGGIALQRKPTALGDVIRHVVAEQQSVQPARRIACVVTGDLQGDWDTDRLRQVLSNLIGNALQHGRDDAPVEVQADGRAPDSVRVVVGSGGEIPPTLLPQLFDPFRSGPGREVHGGPVSSGLGLGLYIVQQIVLSHGGQVQVNSGAGRTEFSLSLPRRVS